MSDHRVHVIDIEEGETDDTCGMKYWMKYFEGGTGVMRKQDLLPVAMDLTLRRDLKTLASMEDISPATIHKMIEEMTKGLTPEDKKDTRKMELLYRRLGMFASFALFMEPRIRNIYSTIDIKSQVKLERESIHINVYQDRILQAKTTGEIVYREYHWMPSSPNEKRKWQSSWHYKPHLHIGIKAIEERLKVKPIYGHVLGFLSGFYTPNENRLCHPYVWAYRHKQRGEWDTFLKTDSAWEATPTWNYPGGIVAWVQRCGQEVADRVFQLTAPTYVDKVFLSNWVSRKLNRARKVNLVSDRCYINLIERAIQFEPRTHNCRPNDGDVCEYLGACWDPKYRELPLMSDEFVIKPSFPIDIEIKGEEEVEGVGII